MSYDEIAGMKLSVVCRRILDFDARSVSKIAITLNNPGNMLKDLILLDMGS